MKNNTTIPASPSNINAPISYSPAFKTTEQMECTKFCGYIGKVVTSHRQKENLLQLVLTDFTPNKLPMTSYYESQDTIPSELLIQATLWDENATACSDIQSGDYVELRNAQIKLSKLGYMELSVRGDRILRKRIPKIKKISNVYGDPRVKVIMQREDKFWKEVMPSMLEEENAIESVHTVVGGSVSIFTVEQILDDNDHIDKEYTVHAAVLDVKPRNLRDWIKKWCPQCEWMQCHQPINGYNLMSALLLQDNHGRRLQLQIYGDEAKAMFPNLTPIRPEEDYIFALKEKIDRILAVNPEKPELYLNIGVKSYMAITNNRQFRLRDTVFRFD
ncbi:hypothetical protein K492DRAFT_199348 [Lichtheimia hyalospora FSU 10163]|nr:hypothetical protein K492DRAFT_199348 [Lichtheimia hyalospora FSU 10163]